MHRIMHRATGRKNDIFDSEFIHDFVKTYSSADIVLVIFEWVLAAFSYGLESRKMNDAIYLIFLKDFPDFFVVFEVNLVKFRLFADESCQFFKY